jgi:hypothetical protein
MEKDIIQDPPRNALDVLDPFCLRYGNNWREWSGQRDLEVVALEVDSLGTNTPHDSLQVCSSDYSSSKASTNVETSW